jgi:hypothetical protein
MYQTASADLMLLATYSHTRFIENAVKAQREIRGIAVLVL